MLIFGGRWPPTEGGRGSNEPAFRNFVWLLDLLGAKMAPGLRREPPKPNFVIELWSIWGGF